MIPEANTVITQSLSPAVAISGIGLLIFGLNNRITTAATRVRDLNRELRQTDDPGRRENIRQQIPMFLERAYLIRNAMFILFGALGMMVFTAVAIAMNKLRYTHWEMLPAWSFLGGLVLMLAAVIIETYETILNMRTLRLDVAHSMQQTDEINRDTESRKAS